MQSLGMLKLLNEMGKVTPTVQEQKDAANRIKTAEFYERIGRDWYKMIKEYDWDYPIEE